MLRGKERKKRKKEQICKVKQSQMKKIYIHYRLSARGKEQQGKQKKNKFRNDVIGLKNYSYKKEKNKKKKRKTLQACKSPMQRQRFITTIKSVTEYTHIHIYPSAKLKQSNKNKIQQIDPANKGNKKKLCLPVKKKTD